MKLLCSVAAVFLCALTPAMAAESLSADDEAKLEAMEIKFFAHTNLRNDTTQRVDALEQFVLGTTTQATAQRRIYRLTVSTGLNLNDRHAEKIAQAPSRIVPAVAPTQRMDSPDTLEFTGPVYLMKKVSVQKVNTVVDRIESLETALIGRKDCAQRLQKRVARLENIMFGNSIDEESTTITARVNRLMQAMYERHNDLHHVTVDGV